ncbi:uncharacterized protein LOC111711798 [Eurytemora carolleeae]|uniref:uncharacterized protein LOC111711798 n=1 Tax=Eurytemora carolleeae TaxID=1294199 RepID=UPI000C777152|nr:uncharacterized protein LOC111711798 [Eurytemora carolleeae]|eukprot:XP_023342011.1 uncharacterized protein LOC111711798 [Eurytemora affinis]
MLSKFVWLILLKDCVAGFNIGKTFTKINGSRNIFSATSGPAIEKHHCAFKCAAFPYCDIWEYKDGLCTTGFKFVLSPTTVTSTTTPVAVLGPSTCTVLHYMTNLGAVVAGKITEPVTLVALGSTVMIASKFTIPATILTST